jgi:hypothetical protein
MEGYRRIIDIVIENNDRDMAEKETMIFNEHIDQFSHFYKNELMEEDSPAEENLNEGLLDTMPDPESNVTDSAEIEE